MMLPAREFFPSRFPHGVANTRPNGPGSLKRLAEFFCAAGFDFRRRWPGRVRPTREATRGNDAGHVSGKFPHRGVVIPSFGFRLLRVVWGVEFIGGVGLSRFCRRMSGFFAGAFSW
jgi:hypothetical protein